MDLGLQFEQQRLLDVPAQPSAKQSAGYDDLPDEVYVAVQGAGLALVH